MNRIVGGLRVEDNEPDPPICPTCGHALAHHKDGDCQGCFVESWFTDHKCVPQPPDKWKYWNSP